MVRKDTIPEIWLEVSNVALNEGEVGNEQKITIDIQLKGDGEDDRWLSFNSGVDKFKPLMEAMKEKRPVLAKLTPVKIGGTAKNPELSLRITGLRISFSVSPVRG
ncbi:MAG TPA: hypothetical protein VLC46_23305 [Thermoanaerobaculia bacterium]|jgi:hypothetical protein|nr:hypothetical protein [Thermoanaerobaculia bacterium]